MRSRIGKVVYNNQNKYLFPQNKEGLLQKSSYSTETDSKLILKENFICKLLKELKINEYNNDEDTQRFIENVLYDDFESLFLEKKRNKQILIGGVNKDLLGHVLHKYILQKELGVVVYINKFLDYPNKSNKNKDDFLNHVITRLDKDFIVNLCLVNFLQIYTHQHSENDKQYVLVPVAIKIDKKIMAYYFNKLRELYIKETNNTVSFVEFRGIWKEKYPEFFEQLDDSLYANLGSKIIDILEYSEMIVKTLDRRNDGQQKDHKEYVLKIVDSNLLNYNNLPKIVSLPTKLPMVCEPKKCSSTSVGGYLLNDEK